MLRTNHAVIATVSNVVTRIARPSQAPLSTPALSIRSLRGIAGTLVMLFGMVVAAQDRPSLHGPPDPTTLESGDLLWPKRPNTVIPYSAGPTKPSVRDNQQWEKERQAYLSELKRKPDPLSELEKARFAQLDDMSYRQFLAVYADGESPGVERRYSGRAGVGHTAIVRIVNGKATVVEAIWGTGVREVTYDAWAKERENDIVWHGRVRGVSEEQRAGIAEFAATQVNKPYKFWLFDLSDESGFYCSKLAWLSIQKATGIVADGNADPQRFLWLSPKQLLRSKHFAILQGDGSYGTK